MRKNPIATLVFLSLFVNLAPAIGQESEAIPIPWVEVNQETEEKVDGGDPIVAIAYSIDWQPIRKVTETAVQDRKPVLVLIGADFCHGCRQLEKNLNVISSTDRFKDWHLAKVDYSKDRDEALSLMKDVPVLPQLILSQWDEKVQRWNHRKLVGSPNPKELESWLFRPTGAQFKLK